MAANTSGSAMSFSRRALHALVVATPIFFCMGNSCADDFFGTNTGVDGGTVTPIAGSQLEVTVDGVHVGPLALAAGSYASFVDTVGGVGEASSSDLVIYAVTSESTFALHVTIFGADVQPIHAASYAIETALGTQTDNGAVSLSGVPTVTAGQVTLECDDGTCGGAALTITELDSTQVSGYLSATMANAGDGQESLVVSTFVVPMQTYAP